MAARKNNHVLVIVLLVLVLAAVAYFLLLNAGDDVSWRQSYKPGEKMPYDTYVIRKLLEVNAPDKFTEVADSMHLVIPDDPTPEVDNYVFIGDRLYADEKDCEKLFRFIQAGNTVMLIVNEPEDMFTDSILATSDELSFHMTEEYEDEESLNFIDYSTYGSYLDSMVYPAVAEDYSIPDFQLKYINYWTAIPYHWTHFSDDLFTCYGDSVTVLGTITPGWEEYSTSANFIGMKIGRGELYLHSTPLAFTNYHMLNDTCMRYVRTVMQHLGSGHTYWDEENRDYDIHAFNKKSHQDNNLGQEGPLEFILSERALRTAWYLILLSAFLYLIFGARRKQRIIPVQENMENTSIEYAEVISQLFMKQADHSKLVDLRMDLFRAHLRERYMIRFPPHLKDEDEELFRKISQRSGAPLDLVTSIFEQYRYLASISHVDTPMMLKFHSSIESFYEIVRQDRTNEKAV